MKKSCCARRRSIINLSGSCTVVKQKNQKPPYCSHYHRFDKFSNAALVFRVGMAIKWWAVSAICAKEFRYKKSKYGSNTETCCAWRHSTMYFLCLIVQKGFLRRVRRVCCHYRHRRSSCRDESPRTQTRRCRASCWGHHAGQDYRRAARDILQQAGAGQPAGAPRASHLARFRGSGLPHLQGKPTEETPSQMRSARRTNLLESTPCCR